MGTGLLHWTAHVRAALPRVPLLPPLAGQRHHRVQRGWTMDTPLFQSDAERESRIDENSQLIKTGAAVGLSWLL
eukprot:scaffold102672_cov27-Tisochrysis_lutea.AAC.4